MTRQTIFWLFPLFAVVGAFIIQSYTLLLLAVIWSAVLLVGSMVSKKRS